MWRGVACLIVVIYHSAYVQLFTPGIESPAASGEPVSDVLMGVVQYFNIGVPMFFVISGYCISATADSSRRKSKPVSTYFWRRLRRIFPPYWFALLISIFVFVLADFVLFPRFLSSSPFPILRPWWYSLDQWLGNLTLTETWRYHFGGRSKGFFMGQAWTLCYEEQFYAVTGIVLLLSPARFFAGTALVTIGTAGVLVAARALNIAVDGFFFDGLWFHFAAGIVVYYIINYANSVERNVLLGVLVISALAAILGVLGLTATDGVAFSFALILLAIHRWDNALCSCRWLTPLFLSGTLCYSLYLMHGIVARIVAKAAYDLGVRSDWTTLFITVPVGLAASLLIAWPFYLLVERRFLNPPQRVEVRTGLTGPKSSPQLLPGATAHGGVASDVKSGGAVGFALMTDEHQDLDQRLTVRSEPLTSRAI
jgi:peptidoglycan/LPS O-acetylase OafA/YrhL